MTPPPWASCGRAGREDITAPLGRKLGWTLTAVAGSVDPEVFVIGGVLSHARNILLDRIQSEYRKFAFHAFRDTEFVLAELGNDNLHSSDAGIHAASYGGLWQCAVWGFGGLRMLGGKLSYTLLWKGQKLAVTVTPRTVQITGEKQKETVTLEVWGKEYDCKEELIVVKTKRNG